MTRHLYVAEALPVLLWLGFAGHVQAQSAIQVVNAASYAPGNSFAPGTIVSILGANLTNTTATAPDPANPPTSLGNVTVVIGGIKCGLFYVSPGQINVHIEDSVPIGTASVAIASPIGIDNTTITISNSAPAGLFSLSGTGNSDGAILNAITFTPGPFTVTSPMGAAGAPIGPTYLALYLTGLSLALSASPTVTIGGMQAPVLYFGSAPCCAGLEQINVQLLPKLAGAGTVPVVVSAGGLTSNVVSIDILPNPGSTAQTAPHLTGVAAIPNSKFGLVINSTTDLVELVDTSNGTVVTAMGLPMGSDPGSIAVTADGTLAVVTEHKQNSAAFLNLQSYQLLGQAYVGGGPVAVAIAGSRAFVVNQDADVVTVIDLTHQLVIGTVQVGHAPSAAAVDTARNRVLVTNSGSGTVSAIDLVSLKVTATVALIPNARPLSIQVAAAQNLAVIGDASLSPGQLLAIDLTSDTAKTIGVGGPQAGSWSAAAAMGSEVFLADPVDGEVAIVTFNRDANQQITLQAQVADVQPGVSTLDVNAQQNLLIVAQSNGQVILFNLASNSVTANVAV